MEYTIGEAAEQLGITASALRYYDKEGLLPFVQRSAGGIRVFGDSDFEWLRVIDCMKKAGMSIKEIRRYVELALQGDNTIELRLEMFRKQRERLQKQLEELNHTMDMVEYKCWYYETAKAAGSVQVPQGMPEENVPERFQKIRRELKHGADGAGK